MAKLTGLGHVALWVKDLDRTLQFYAKLGCRELFRMNYSDGTLYLAYVQVADGQCIEFFPDSLAEDARTGRKAGVHHFCLTVDDIDSYVGELAAAGIELSRPVTLGGAGCRQGWITDPDGNSIEIMQMLPGCAVFEGIRRAAAGLPPRHFNSSWPRSG